ncbi:MAG TPA: S8 family peptidase [Verrucomicrobiae bacterium]|nr:S8 family peptidase [Verrucomicrobiae bacterium]
MKKNSEASDSVWISCRRNVFCNLLLLGLALAFVVLPGVVVSAPGGASFHPGHILIKPKEGVSPSVLTNLNARLGSRILRKFDHIGNLHVIGLPRSVSVPTAIAFFEQSGLVKYAEPDYFVQPLEVPNDFYFTQGNQMNLYNLGQYGGTPGADINATNGWDYGTSASNIIVAVVDTGIRYTHEDLAPNMWLNPQENLDGYTNDLYGINLVNNGRGNGDPWDDYGHGSHVAGIIGAVGNNGVGIAGICWQVQLMALKFIDANGNGTISDAITCMDFARSHGAKVVNASWGSFTFTSVALWDAINSLRDAEIIFVGAAGNSAANNDAYPLYPASYSSTLDNVLSVAATDNYDRLAWFSDFGPTTVNLAAPGVPVFSCWNGSDSDYQYDNGTSMACAQVTGTCALRRAQYPNLSMLQIVRRVLNGVDLLPGLAGKCATGGRLNLGKALAPTVGIAKAPPSVSVWMDDALPGGAATNDPGGDSWTAEPWVWVTNNPPPFSGTAAHQSPLISGIHEHMFQNATNTLQIFSGDVLFNYVYLDPVNPPREIMIEWSDGCWEHRAFWGENLITWGEYGTSSRLYMGGLPPAGQWTRLEVPASALQLEGAVLQGMSFMLYDGSATWDYTGRSSSGGSSP